MSLAIVQKAIYSTLSTNTAITTAMGGTAIFAGYAPETASEPYIIFGPEGGGELNDTPKDFIDENWNIKITTLDAQQAGTVTTLIRNALHRQDVTMGLGWKTVRVEHFGPFLYHDLVEGKAYVHSGGVYRFRAIDESYVRDGFTDTNGVSVVNHVPYKAPAGSSGWGTAMLTSSDVGGGYTIQSNQAQGTIVSGGVVIDAGTPDCVVSMDWTPTEDTTADRVYMVLRYGSPGNELAVLFQKAGLCTLSQYVADTPTQLDSQNSGGFVKDTTYTLSAVVRGSGVKVYVDNVLLLSGTTTAGLTNTLFGFLLGAGTGVGKINNFTIVQ